MIEGLIAIIMLFIGVVNGNTDYFLASALFSIASYLGEKEDKNG